MKRERTIIVGGQQHTLYQQIAGLFKSLNLTDAICYFRTPKFHLVLFLFLIHAHTIWTQTPIQTEVNISDSIPPFPLDPDSDFLRIDTSPPDTSLVRIDTTKAIDSSNLLTAPIVYQATDSIIMSGTGIVEFFGKGDVTYGEMNIKADYLKFNTNTRIVDALGVADSTGDLQGKPVFTEGSSSFESNEMYYNLDSKKGFIKNVTTQEGEGFVTSKIAKKDENDVICMQHGRYTTCDHHDHPHFYISLSKAKVRPGKTTVSGPAHLVIEDVHLPLFIPFGFFPNTESFSSGVIIPTFGEESTRGYYLQGMGYYFYINDYVDFELSGDVYGNASWGIRGQSTYRKRYKYSGSFNLSYQNTKTSEKGLNDYAEAKDFRVQWSHRKDSKSSPFSSFTAGVNYSTSSYDRNNVNNYYNPNSLAQTQTQSSITYSKVWPESPWSLNTSLRASQSKRDSSVTLGLPQLSLNMSRIYPFKRKNAVGSSKWYEKIGITYGANMNNTITTHEDEIFDASLVKDWRNGISHDLSTSTSFNLLNTFTLSPSFSYRERWHAQSYRKAYNDSTQRLEMVDTVYGFHRNYDYSFSVGTSTKIYGFFRPAKWFNKLIGNRVEALRHMMTPSVSLSYRPDFSEPKYGAWDTYEYTRLGVNGYEVVENQYSIYDGTLYGGPSSGQSGSVSLSLGNTLEMKVLNTRDTTSKSQFKKISILEALNFNSSYNMLADSLNWSNISMNARTKIMKGLSINLSASFDPYSYTFSNGRATRVSTSYWRSKGQIAHMTNMNMSTSYTFNNDTFKKKKSSKEKSDEEQDETPPSEEMYDEFGNPLGPRAMQGNKNDKGTEFGEDGYAVFSIPWSLSVSYSLQRVRDRFNEKKIIYNLRTRQNLNFSASIQPTKKMSISLSSGYDFDAQKMSMTSINLTRDLHCWQLTASVSIGTFNAYNIGIRVNSSILRDLKYDKRNDPRAQSLFK